MYATRIGAIAEKKFTVACMERGLNVFEPLVDDDGMDFVVKSSTGFKSIQVKSTKAPSIDRPNTYKIGVKRGANSRDYDKTTFDFLVCYMFDIDTYYIIPKERVSSKTIRINPMSVKCKYISFKEAWELLI